MKKKRVQYSYDTACRNVVGNEGSGEVTARRKAIDFQCSSYNIDMEDMTKLSLCFNTLSIK